MYCCDAWALWSLIWRYVLRERKSLTLHKYKDWILWNVSQWRWSRLCVCVLSAQLLSMRNVQENSSLALMVFCWVLLTRHTAHAWSPLACRTSPWPAETGNRHTALHCGPGSCPSHRWPCDCSGGPTNGERNWKEMRGKALKRWFWWETPVCLNEVEHFKNI